MEDSTSWSEALVRAVAVAGFFALVIVAVLFFALGSDGGIMVAVAGFFALVIVAIWHLAASSRARMSVPREEAYRKMAEEVVAAQRQTTQALEQMATELAGLRARTTEVERMLKEVG